MGHTPLHPGVQGDGTLDQSAAPAVGGRHRTKPLSIGAPGKTKTQKNFHPDSPDK